MGTDYEALRRGLGNAPGSAGSIIAAAYSVPGVRYAFLIEEMGAGTVVVESGEADIEPVRRAVERTRTAGVDLSIITLDDLGPLIERRVSDALVRQAHVFRKADEAMAQRRTRMHRAQMAGCLLAGAVGAWLLGMAL